MRTQWLTWFLHCTIINATLDKKDKLKRVNFDFFLCAALGIKVFAWQFAFAQVVTGSIGVIGIFRSAWSLYNRLDYEFAEMKRGNRALLGSPHRTLSRKDVAFFKKYGARPRIVLQSASMVPFLRGAVDVASAMYYNEYHKLMEAGMRKEEIRAFYFSDYGMNFPEDGIYCSETMRREHPDICSAIVTASIKGWAYAIAHEAETLDIVMARCKHAKMPTNRNHQRWMLRAMAELIQYRVGGEPEQWGTLLPEDYKNVAKVLLKQELIPAIPPFNEFYRPVLAPGGASP